MRRFWTPERLAWLAATYRQHRIAKIPPLFTARWGLAISESCIKSAIARHHLDSGRPRGPMPGERPSLVWTPERLDWLRERRETLTITPLTAAFNARFGVSYPAHSLANALKRYGISSPRSGRFHPGQTPWNAGMVGYQAGGRSAETRWQPGNKVWHQLPIWSYRQDPDGGYWFFKYREASPAGYSRRDWIAVHRLHWQDAHGPLAAGQVVIMLDTDPNHTELDNLACLTRRELVIFNRLVSQVPPERELRRALVTRAKLLAGAYRAADRLGLSVAKRREAIGVLPATQRERCHDHSA